jgi:hypothetical protein
MDEGSAKVLVTVAAMKLLLGRLFALYYTKSTLTPDEVKQAHKILIEKWAEKPLVSSNDPALSDVMSDEVLREIERFLQGVEKDFRAMRRD